MSERTLFRVASTATALLLVALLVRILPLARSMETVADYVSPLVMGHDAHLYPGSKVTLGNYGWFSGFWAARGVSALPVGPQLAAVLPTLIWLAVAGALAAQARRVWGRAAAVVLLAVTVGIGGQAWLAAASWSAHGTTWWAMVIAGMTVVAEAGGRHRAAAVGAALTVIWGGLCLTGDKLGLAVLVLPLAATALTAAVRRAWPLAIKCAALLGLVFLSSLVFGAVREGAGLVQNSYRIDTVPYESLGGYAGQALSALTMIWFPFGPIVLAATVAYVGAAAAIAGAWTAPAVVRRNADLDRAVWTAFWFAAALGTVAAFVVSTTSFVGGAPVPRYLYALPLAAGGLLAAATGSGRSPRVTLAAAAFVAAGGAYGFFANPPARLPAEHGPAVAKVRAAARRYDVTRGFTGYNTAYPMERSLEFAVTLAPIQPCPGGAGLCPFYLHRIDDAYTPQPGIRSFILVDHSPIAVPGAAEWVTSEPAGVKPERRVDVGDGLEMLIYDHDVARELGPLDAP